MKRVQAACLCQALHFMLKEGAERSWAVKHVEQDVEQYKKTLECSRVRYKFIGQIV